MKEINSSSCDENKNTASRLDCFSLHKICRQTEGSTDASNSLLRPANNPCSILAVMHLSLFQLPMGVHMHISCPATLCCSPPHRDLSVYDHSAMTCITYRPNHVWIRSFDRWTRSTQSACHIKQINSGHIRLDLPNGSSLILVVGSTYTLSNHLLNFEPKLSATSPDGFRAAEGSSEAITGLEA